MNIDIRPFRDSDADDVATVVCRNLREVNSKDYSPDVIEDLAGSFTPDKIKQFSTGREMFVAEADGRVVGTASLARDNRTQDEKYVCLTVFVLPELHGNGIGKMLMERVEDTARNKGAAALQVPASITALPFYRNRGYREDTAARFDPNEGWVWMTKALAGGEDSSGSMTA